MPSVYQITPEVAGFSDVPIDVAPGDYAWVGHNTNIFLSYGQYSHADRFYPDGAQEIPATELSISVLLLRSLHYRELAGQCFMFQAVLPIGRINDARLGGADQPVSDGIGDLTLGATWYPIASAEPTGTTLGLSMFLTMPTGSYDFGEVSLGSGTWTVTPQIGVIQGLGGGFFLDGVLDVALQSDHREQGIVVSRDPSIQAQVYMRYQVSPTRSLSIGYSGQFNGDMFLDDDYTGQKTRADQLRIYANTFIDDSTQIQALLAKDIKVEGGFKNDAVVQFRYMKMF